MPVSAFSTPTRRFQPLGPRGLRSLFVFFLAVICLTAGTGISFAQGNNEPVDPDAYRRARDQWLREQAEQAAEQEKQVIEMEEVPAEEWVAVGVRVGWVHSDGANGVATGLTGNFWVGEFGEDYRMGIRPEFQYHSYRELDTNFHDFFVMGNFYVEKNMPSEGLGGMFAPYLFLGPGYEMFDGGRVSFTQAFAFDAGAGVRAGHPQSPLVFEVAYMRGFSKLASNKVRVSIGVDWGF